MVQILQRTRPTFGEQVAGGIQKGMDTGSQMAMQKYKSGLTEKTKQAEVARKLADFQKVKDSAEFKKLTPIQQFSLEQEFLGKITGGTAKSLINADRELQSYDRFADLMSPNKEEIEPSSQNFPQQNSTSEPSQNDLEDMISPPKSKNIPKNKLEAIPDSKLTVMQGHPDKNIAAAARAEADRRKQEKEFEFKSGLANTKEVTASFNENKDYINSTYDKYEDSLRRDAILDRMNELDESGELSDSGVINLLESLGLNQEWLKNPANEEYTKLALDLLGGGTLQADYGSRVLASEFKVSQQRIPTLMQTKEGRRQIAENLKTMMLPAKLKQERTEYYIDKAKRTGKALPHDLRGTVLKDIKPQLEEAYDKFKQRNGRYTVRQGTRPDDSAIEKYYYLTNGDENKAIKMMKEDGYDVNS